jgi:hypothetical protein
MLLRAVVFLAFLVPLWAWELYHGWVSLAALRPAESAELVALDSHGSIRLFLLAFASMLAGLPSVLTHLLLVRRSPGVPGRLSQLFRSACAGSVTFFLIRPLLPLTADLNRHLNPPPEGSFLLGLGVFVFAAALATAAVEGVGNRVQVPAASLSHRR